MILLVAPSLLYLHHCHHHEIKAFYLISPYLNSIHQINYNLSYLIKSQFIAAWAEKWRALGSRPSAEKTGCSGSRGTCQDTFRAMLWYH